MIRRRIGPVVRWFAHGSDSADHRGAVAGVDGADACVSRSGIGDVSACVRDAISELLEQFDDALVALDFDAPDSCSPKPTALPKVVALTTRR